MAGALQTAGVIMLNDVLALIVYAAMYVLCEMMTANGF